MFCHQLLNVHALVQCHTSPHGICGGLSVIVTGLASINSVLPCPFMMLRLIFYLHFRKFSVAKVSFHPKLGCIQNTLCTRRDREHLNT